MATRDLHDRLDGHFEGVDPARRSGLARILTVHAAAVPAIETALQDWSPVEGLAIYRSRPLTQALRVDLAAMGLPFPAPLPIGPVGDDARLGLAYVLTGSRVGNRMLRRQWSRAVDPAVRAAGAYLAWRAGEEAWPDLVRLIDVRGREGADWDAVLGGARLAFGRFLAAATVSGRAAA